MKSQALTGEEGVIDILTARCSQKLWHYNPQEDTHSAASQMGMRFVNHYVEIRDPPRRTHNQPESSPEVLRRSTR